MWAALGSCSKSAVSGSPHGHQWQRVAVATCKHGRHVAKMAHGVHSSRRRSSALAMSSVPALIIPICKKDAAEGFVPFIALEAFGSGISDVTRQHLEAEIARVSSLKAFSAEQARGVRVVHTGNEGNDLSLAALVTVPGVQPSVTEATGQEWEAKKPEMVTHKAVVGTRGTKAGGVTQIEQWECRPADAVGRIPFAGVDDATLIDSQEDALYAMAQSVAVAGAALAQEGIKVEAIMHPEPSVQEEKRNALFARGVAAGFMKKWSLKSVRSGDGDDATEDASDNDGTGIAAGVAQDDAVWGQLDPIVGKMPHAGEAAAASVRRSLASTASRTAAGETSVACFLFR